MSLLAGCTTWQRPSWLSGGRPSSKAGGLRGPVPAVSRAPSAARRGGSISRQGPSFVAAHARSYFRKTRRACSRPPTRHQPAIISTASPSLRQECNGSDARRASSIATAAHHRRGLLDMLRQLRSHGGLRARADCSHPSTAPSSRRFRVRFEIAASLKIVSTCNRRTRGKKQKRGTCAEHGSFCRRN